MIFLFVYSSLARPFYTFLELEVECTWRQLCRSVDCLCRWILQSVFTFFRACALYPVPQSHKISRKAKQKKINTEEGLKKSKYYWHNTVIIIIYHYDKQTKLHV